MARRKASRDERGEGAKGRRGEGANMNWKFYELKDANGFVVAYVNAKSNDDAIAERHPAVTAVEVHPPRVFSEFVRAHVACGMSLREAVTRVRSAHAHLATETMDHIGSHPCSDPEFRELQRQF